MTEQSAVSIDDVRALVAERHRFDEWLSALEDRRDSTPAHVYERVHADYEARRAQVMTSLHAHVPELEQLLADLDGHAGQLAGRAQADEDERAEAMLRHAVGEYDDARWEDVRNRVEASLATLAGERAALDSQRDDVRSLLQSARPDVPPTPEPEYAAPEASQAAAAAHSADAAPEIATDFAAAPVQHPASAATDTNTTADWLGAVTPADVPAVEGDADRIAESQDALIDGLGEVENIELTPEHTRETPADSHKAAVERPSIWGGRNREAAPADAADAESVDVFGDATAERSSPGTASPAPQSPAAPAAPAAASDDTFDDLAFLRSVIDPQATSPAVPRAPGSGDAQKTLRCTECGTMNLPTEWYCERCGGELAAF